MTNTPSLSPAQLASGFRKLSSQVRLGAIHRILIASFLRVASRELDIFARAAYIEGLLGYTPNSIARSYRKNFEAAREAISKGQYGQSPIARVLVEERGLSPQEALAMVSDKNVGIAKALEAGIRSAMKAPVRGLEAEDVAASLAAGRSPLTGKAMKYGEGRGVFYWLGANAPSQISLSGIKAIAFKEAANRARDIVRGTSEAEMSLVQLDAPVSGEDPGTLLQDILTGDEDSISRASFMELASLLYTDPAVMREIDKEIRNRLGGELQEAVWSAILADPDLLLVGPGGVGVKGDALSKAVSTALGREVSRPAAAKNFKEKVLPQIGVALRKDSVVSRALRRREILDIIQEATRPPASRSKRTPVPYRTSSADRAALIRLASALPKGSSERKVILSSLKRS